MYFGLGVLALLVGGLIVIWTRKAFRRRRMRAMRMRHMQAMRRNARMQEEDWAQTRPHKPVSIAQNGRQKE